MRLYELPDRFYFALGSMSTGRSDKTYERWSFLGIFNPLVPFPQVLWQIKD